MASFGGQGFNSPGSLHQGGIGGRMKQAGRAQENWMRAANEARKKGLTNAKGVWDTAYDPYKGFGGERTQAWESLLNDPSSITKNPGYAFRLKQGTDTLENSAAARGGLLSGNTARALTEYGQDYATNEYDRALAREAAGAQFGAGVDTTYANAVADIERRLGESESDMYGGFSNYAFWHEQQGMDEAKQWMGFLRGALGGMSGQQGGQQGSFSGSGTQSSPYQFVPQNSNQGSYYNNLQNSGRMYGWD